MNLEPAVAAIEATKSIGISWCVCVSVCVSWCGVCGVLLVSVVSVNVGCVCVCVFVCVWGITSIRGGGVHIFMPMGLKGGKGGEEGVAKYF